MTNNQLKIIAMIAMLLDHIGKELLPQYEILQIIGRIAFPIFAYMVAEGCTYTRNRSRYLINISFLAFGCQCVYYVATGSMYQNILVTFVLSIAIIYCIDNFRKKKDILSGVILLLELCTVIFLCFFAANALGVSDFQLDYGFFGVLLPVVVYYAPKKNHKLFCAALALIALGYTFAGIQWFALLALPFLMIYNGTRGKRNLKYLFYIFYPSHLALIYLIGLLK